MGAFFAFAGVQICLLDVKNLTSPNIWATANLAVLLKKVHYETSYLI